MSKSYNQIIKNFSKTIKQCQARTEQLGKIADDAIEESKNQLAKADEAQKEKQLTINLEKKISELIGV